LDLLQRLYVGSYLEPKKMPHRLTVLDAMPEEESCRQARLILCSNVLPVYLSKDETTGEWSAEMDIDSLMEDGPMLVSLKQLDEYEVLYVGNPRTFVEPNERPVVERLLNKLKCYPVWTSALCAHNHFQGYCKGILWPTFHNVIDLYSRADPDVMIEGGNEENHHDEGRTWHPVRSWSPMEAEACWPDYCAMNGLFARKVVEIYSDGDLIWAHDYHLLLLPNYLLRKLSNAHIALFLHVPFPSSEIFRTLATREEILRAMLCADHIGFHLYEYARHFLTCCTRMLGLKYEARRGGVLVVNNQGRDVAITCSHMGLDTTLTRQRLDSPEVLKLGQDLYRRLHQADKSHLEGSEMLSLQVASERRFIIVGIDEVEGLRGLGLKLLALDRLFTDYSYLRNRVTLVQIGLKLDSRPDDYKSCHQEVMGLVKVVKKKWGENVVQYEEHSCYTQDSRLALFQNADVFLNTSVRVGIDMNPFEYLMARRNRAGCIVMSEFSACSRVLHGALRVNPFKTSALAATIEEALSMSEVERTARSARDLEVIETNTLFSWARDIIKDVKEAHQDSSKPMTKFGGGFGTRFLPSFSKTISRQSELETLEFGEAFKAAQRRLIFLDYSGTLVETSSLRMYMKRGGTARTWHYEKGGSKRPGGCLETRDPISDSARRTLIDLCLDEKNIVVVVSSDLRDELDQALRGIPNLGLIAENGFVFRPHPSGKWISAVDTEDDHGGDWYGGNSPAGLYEAETESAGDSSEVGSLPEVSGTKEMNQWQEVTMKVMQSYSHRTNGSFVWKSPSAVSFNCVLADPELGAMQSSNLALELEQILAVMPLTVEQGKGSVTVRLRGVNRGTALRELIHYLNYQDSRAEQIDFVATFGDDNEDESSFKATNKYRNKADSQKCFAVRVGASPTSKAKFYVEHTEDVAEVLAELVQVSSSGKVRRSFSQGDFGSQDHSNVLGNFKTKQSYIKLPEDISDEFPSFLRAQMSTQGSPTANNQGGMKMSPSYVASAKEMEELFGSSTALPDLKMNGASPTMAMSPHSFPVAEGEGILAGDPRALPPTSTVDGTDDEAYTSDEEDHNYAGDTEYADHSNVDGSSANVTEKPSRGLSRYTSEATQSSATDRAFHQIMLQNEQPNHESEERYKVIDDQSSEVDDYYDEGPSLDREMLKLGLAALSGAAMTFLALSPRPRRI